MSQNQTNKPSAIIAKEEFRPIDISIAGTPHRIVCPVDEVKNLEKNAEFINQKIRDLRRDIKHKTPTNEEFLVLVCLELYDEVQTLQKQLADADSEKQQVAAMIDKINTQARSML
ncbi:cell division protein ZapA [Moraxella cuniculi DSM 21768]|uniref:Cell division protein ZapA n=1 Tax=Moraxella cuniculi DSM 21768 TaxID=1122245 RepID=A0A1N7F772_9GAMM|nr:cell division protein ZapA [Moraxella cuniculi]OOS06423.1 cell division protein ZapA [Moraxella cuniculi]SIR96102.1 cell division protein ZapA [Moraxella cuniculi DSM 21768]